MKRQKRLTKRQRKSARVLGTALREQAEAELRMLVNDAEDHGYRVVDSRGRKVRLVGLEFLRID